jgi:DNA-binding NtrC family response regulator
MPDKDHKKTVIVVDDDESIRKTFSLLFQQTYRVCLARDAREALDRFRHQEADLIIADYKLPGLNGMEMIGKFREAGYVGEAILISAYPDQISLQDLGRYAISQVFVKPPDLDILLRSVDRLLYLRDVALLIAQP